MNGQRVLVCSYQFGAPPGSMLDNGFLLILQGILPQNFFTSITNELTPPETFTTASAVVFDNTTWAAENFTVWAWGTDTNIFFFAPGTVVDWT